jgi:hypothetical protein
METVDYHVRRLLGITRGVSVFDPQNKSAADMASVKPVKQSRARTAYVQIAGGARSKSNTNVHSGNLTVKLVKNTKF